MPEQKETSGGLSIQTLLISAAAAVAAATIVPMIWERGTLIATAMTPVIVAIVSEALKKPVETVSSVAPKVAPKVTRRSGTGAAVRRFDPDAAQTRHHQRVGARGEGPERFEPLPPHRRDEAPPTRTDDPFGLREESRSPGRHWKIAVVTGLLAFVIAAGFVTFTELAAGGSVSSDRRTSIFGGRDRSSSTPTPTATPSATEAPGEESTATPAPTATTTPEESATPTPTPSVSATPTPSVAAPQTTPAPTP